MRSHCLLLNDCVIIIPDTNCFQNSAEIQDLSQKVRPRRRLKSFSAGVGSMKALITAEATSEDVSLKSESLTKTAKCLADIYETNTTNMKLARPVRNLERQQGQGARREHREQINRQKCLSEGVGSMQFSPQMDPIKEAETEQKRATSSELSKMSTKIC